MSLIDSVCFLAIPLVLLKIKSNTIAELMVTGCFLVFFGHVTMLLLGKYGLAVFSISGMINWPLFMYAIGSTAGNISLVLTVITLLLTYFALPEIASEMPHITSSPILLIHFLFYTFISGLLGYSYEASLDDLKALNPNVTTNDDVLQFMDKFLHKPSLELRSQARRVAVMNCIFVLTSLGAFFDGSLSPLAIIFAPLFITNLYVQVYFSQYTKLIANFTLIELCILASIWSLFYGCSIQWLFVVNSVILPFMGFYLQEKYLAFFISFFIIFQEMILLGFEDLFDISQFQYFRPLLTLIPKQRLVISVSVARRMMIIRLFQIFFYCMIGFLYEKINFQTRMVIQKTKETLQNSNFTKNEQFQYFTKNETFQNPYQYTMSLVETNGDLRDVNK